VRGDLVDLVKGDVGQGFVLEVHSENGPPPLRPCRDPNGSIERPRGSLLRRPGTPRRRGPRRPGRPGPKGKALRVPKAPGGFVIAGLATIRIARPDAPDADRCPESSYRE
jgi:hypothetical protein